MVARTLEVTVAPDSVETSAGGKAQPIAFSATYRGMEPFDAVVRVKAEDPALERMIEIEGSSRRRFERDQTDQVTVVVTIPPKTAPGRLTFRLAFVGVDNPDEDYTESPAVAITIKEQKIEPFPWWIVIAASAVLVVAIGIGLYFALRSDAIALGAACGQGSTCVAGATCAAPTEGSSDERRCLGEVGFSGCESDAQCVTGRCEAGVCATGGLALGAPCTPADSCGDDARCMAAEGGTELRCRGKLGVACSEDDQCESGSCRDGACVERSAIVTTGGHGQPCDPSGRCDARLECSSDKICLGAVGFDCESEADCAGYLCRDRECSMLGQACRNDDACDKRSLVCQDRMCKLDAGEPCDPLTSGLCASSECGSNGKCTRVKQCQVNADCGSTMLCDGGSCYLRRGQPCNVFGGPYCELFTCRATPPDRRTGFCPSQPCSSSNKCPNGSTCSNGRCSPWIKGVLLEAKSLHHSLTPSRLESKMRSFTPPN